MLLFGAGFATACKQYTVTVVDKPSLLSVEDKYRKDGLVFVGVTVICDGKAPVIYHNVHTPLILATVFYS